MMKTIFFDLDNTLYNTEQYYLGAFENIVEYLRNNYKIDKNKSYQFLVDLWKKKSSAYPRLFDDLLDHFNIKEDVKVIVQIFNKHPIESCYLYYDSISMLKKLKHEGYKIGIITDGNVHRQKRKIESSSLKNLVDDVTYTNESKPKPSSLPFINALNKMRIRPSDAIYVADNPFLDFKGAKIVGMKTTRILRGEFAGIKGGDDIDYTIRDLNELWKVINT